MKDGTSQTHPERASRDPFFASSALAGGAKGAPLSQTLKSALRLLSAISLVFAIVTALLLVALDAAHLSGHISSWHIKSAFPLIGIGLSYLLLQFTIPRSRAQRWLSIAVSGAFIIWGAEQFVPAPRIATLMDDIVVFLFVTELAFVIHSLIRPQEIEGD